MSLRPRRGGGNNPEYCFIYRENIKLEFIKNPPSFLMGDLIFNIGDYTRPRNK